jgi:hypothetical protein
MKRFEFGASGVSSFSILVIRGDFEPHCIEDREGAGEAETQDPAEVPHHSSSSFNS